MAVTNILRPGGSYYTTDELAALNRTGPSGTNFSGLLPLQTETTATRRNIPPQGYATLRDYLSRGIPTLTAGSRTAAKLDELNADPLKSTLFRNTITPLLASLVPSETAARRNLADRFRQTGQLQSGAFAEQARLQENDILGNRNELVARHAGDIYSRLLQSLGLGLEAEKTAAQPFQLGTSLLQALRDEGVDTAERRFAPNQFLGDITGGGGTGRGGAGSVGGGGPTGIDVNKYSVAEVPYNPHNPFDFRVPESKTTKPTAYIPPEDDSSFFPGFGAGGFGTSQIPSSYSDDLARAYGG